MKKASILLIFICMLSFSVWAQTESDIESATREVDRPVRKEVQKEMMEVDPEDIEIGEEGEKTSFNVVLIDPGTKKVKIIKIIHEETGANLKRAKRLIEITPCVIREGISKEEAERIKAILESSGADVELRPQIQTQDKEES
ncbi:ribosomal protein L7/L12 [Candidatus Omnitrophota bacterium]